MRGVGVPVPVVGSAQFAAGTRWPIVVVTMLCSGPSGRVLHMSHLPRPFPPHSCSSALLQAPRRNGIKWDQAKGGQTYWYASRGDVCCRSAVRAVNTQQNNNTLGGERYCRECAKAWPKGGESGTAGSGGGSGGTVGVSSDSFTDSRHTRRDRSHQVPLPVP